MQQEEKAEQELPVDKVVEGIGIEMEEGYEHVEQLASGETVQPEDEEQEKTGPLTPEGTSTGGENVGNEEEGEFEETQKLTLVTYISEYFVPETDSVPKNMAAQQISVRSQSGEATEITKLESVLNVEQNGQDEIFFRIPLILRQEYRFPAEKKQLSCDSGGTASEGLYRCGNLSHEQKEKRGKAGDRRGTRLCWTWRLLRLIWNVGMHRTKK